jgi:hypothetical protein
MEICVFRFYCSTMPLENSGACKLWVHISRHNRTAFRLPFLLCSSFPAVRIEWRAGRGWRVRSRRSCLAMR